MKGFVFTNFIDFIEHNFGLEKVDQMIQNSDLESRGVYSAFNSYPFSELAQMLNYVCSTTGMSSDEALEKFGEYMFQYLIQKHNYIISKYKHPLKLIAEIETHIHVEVQKLYEDAELPTFSLIEHSENKLSMIYQSKRGLIYFAIGLIKQTIQHFNMKGEVSIDKNFKCDDKNAVKFDVILKN